MSDSVDPNELITGTFSRREWAVMFAGLGKLPGEAMFEVAKKMQDMMRETVAEIPK